MEEKLKQFLGQQGYRVDSIKIYNAQDQQAKLVLLRTDNAGVYQITSQMMTVWYHASKQGGFPPHCLAIGYNSKRTEGYIAYYGTLDYAKELYAKYKGLWTPDGLHWGKYCLHGDVSQPEEILFRVIKDFKLIDAE